MATHIKNHKNSPNNIAYISGDIISIIKSRILNKELSITDILVPECFSLDSKNDSKFAFKVFEIFPQIKTNLDIYRSYGYKNYGTTQFIELYNIHNKNFGKIIFANMICKKNRYHRSIDYIALAKNIENISNYINNYSKKNDEKIDIVSTRFGTGKSGGQWDFIEQMIEDCWQNFNIQIYYG